jgi:hypothetical protein
VTILHGEIIPKPDEGICPQEVVNIPCKTPLRTFYFQIAWLSTSSYTVYMSRTQFLHESLSTCTITFESKHLIIKSLDKCQPPYANLLLLSVCLQLQCHSVDQFYFFLKLYLTLDIIVQSGTIVERLPLVMTAVTIL